MPKVLQQIKDSMKGKDRKQRSSFKVDEYLSEHKLRNKGYKIKKEGYEIEAKIIGKKDDTLEMEIQASKGGKEILIDNPCYFRNPPMQVWDGTYSNVELDIEGEKKTIKKRNYKVDIKEAMRQIVLSLVRKADVNSSSV